MPVPKQPTADYSDCVAIQKQLQNAVNRLNALADNVAKARHITNFDSDRRKAALAIIAAPLIAAGDSSTAAETKARASELYSEAMRKLGAEYIAAEKVIAQWEATKITIEVARSLLALQRDTIKNL